ncbi:MAG: epoxide hydrolase [Actinomycetota bacterium]|nr:epoxide hydrolase [Actinomycetota bacterium]
MSDVTEIRPFTVEVLDDAITDLRRRLDDTRWTDQIDGSGWECGCDGVWLRDLVRYWANDFDWRSAEARINAFDQVVTTVDGQQIHAICQRSPEPDALPLLLSHGWPGSIVEFLKVLGPLTDPAAHGGEATDAFHVVAPSLPGFAWSGPTTERGWGPHRMGGAFAALMDRLGHDRYGVQGGDWGSIISQHVAGQAPDNVVGCHVNMIAAFPPGRDDDHDDITPAEQQHLDRAAWYHNEDRGYFLIQQTRPQSLGVGLHDSPAGRLAWIGEKFHGWTHHDGDPLDVVDRNDLLANVSAYWFTGTATSSARIYHEFGRDLAAGLLPAVNRDVPFGVSAFPLELMVGRRRWVETDRNVTFWREHDRGGHFAAMERPNKLVADVREFFRPLRKGAGS